MATSQTTPTQLSPTQVTAAQSAQWKQIVRQALDDVRMASPAVTLSDIDPATQTVTVQITIKERTRTNKGPEWMTLHPLFKVPVALPRGGLCALTMPVKTGDEGMLIFCDACIERWLQLGGVQEQTEVRRHDVQDCGFYPGLCSQPNVLPLYSVASAQLRTYDGSVTVDVGADECSLNVVNSFVEVQAALITVEAPAVNIGNSGPYLALVNDTFYQWFVTNVYPFLVSKGYAGPAVPAGSETTVLKGQ